MDRLNAKHSIFAVTILTLSLRAIAATGPLALELGKSTSKVEFLAIGKPAALKIRGNVAQDAKTPLKGQLDLAGTALSGTATLSLSSLTTGIGLRDSHMKDNYLHVAKFPEASIVLDKISLPAPFSTGDSTTGTDFSGKLLLHGVEKPIAGTAQISKKGETLGVKFAFKLKLSDHAIDIPSYLGIKVADEVEITAESEGKLLAKGSPLP